MPVIVLPTPETHESITRPVVFDVIRELLDLTGISALSNIYFPGEDRQWLMPGTAIDNPDQGLSFGKGERFHVEVTEEYLETHALAAAVTQQENVHVFTDAALGVFIKPAYTPTQVTLTVVYRATDKTNAERWRDLMRNKITMGRQALLHEINYHYAIPHEYLVILHHLNELKEAQAGYGEEFEQWLKRCFSERVTTRVTQAGTQPLLTVNEKQVGVVGHFDFEGAPEKAEREGEGANYSISFSYTFYYDKVTACVMQYPLMVHNQVVGRKFRDVTPVYDFAILPNKPSLSRYHYDAVQQDYRPSSPLAGYSIPVWDDWLPTVVPPFTTTMFKIMVALTEDERQRLLSFHELGKNYKLDPELLAFLSQEAPWLTIPGESAFLCTLFRNEVPLDGDAISVDSDLVVRASEPLDLRQRYHVRLAVVHDLFTLSQAARQRLRNNGKVCQMIFKALYGDNRLIERYLPKLIGHNYMPKREFERAAQQIKDLVRPHFSGLEYNRLHVGQFLVRAGHGDLSL